MRHINFSGQMLWNDLFVRSWPFQTSSHKRSQNDLPSDGIRDWNPVLNTNWWMLRSHHIMTKHAPLSSLENREMSKRSTHAMMQRSVESTGLNVVPVSIACMCLYVVVVELLLKRVKGWCCSTPHMRAMHTQVSLSKRHKTTVISNPNNT